MVKPFGTVEGLPTSTVYDIIQDKTGYIWLATDQGVCRYDGHTFQQFGKNEGLASQEILSVFQDTWGRIWFTGLNGAVSYYDDKGLHNGNSDPYLLEISAGSYIGDAFESGNGDLYFMSRFSGLKRLRGTKVETFYPEPVALGISFMFEHEGVVYGVSGAQLYEVGEKLTPVHAVDRPYGFATVRGHHSGEQEPLFSTSVTVWAFQNQSKQSRKYLELDSSLTEVLVIQRHDRDLWVGTRNGLAIYDEEGEGTELLLPGMSVTSICFDHEGGVWIGTLHNGLLYAPNPGFRMYKGVGGRKAKMLALHADDSKIWVSSTINTFYTLDSLGFRPHHLHGTYRSEIPNVKQMRDGRTWVIGKSSSMIIGNDTLLMDEGGRDAYLDEHGQLWFGALKAYRLPVDSIYAYSTGVEGYTSKHQKLVNLILNRVILEQRVICIAGMPGSVAVGTISGLYLYNNSESSLTSAVTLSGEYIIDLQAVPHYDLYVGITVDGNVFTIEENEIQFVPNYNTLPATCVSLGNDNEILVGRQGAAEQWQVIEDGTLLRKSVLSLPGFRVNDIAVRGDQLFIASDEGLIQAAWTHKMQAAATRLELDTLKVNGEARTIGGELALDYDENSVGFSFRSFRFSEMEHNPYEYRLVGLSDIWETTHSGEVVFNSLAPGNYRFEVREKNHPDNVKKMSFTIDPPYWSTTWFRLLVVAVVILIVSLFWAFRLKQLRRRTRLREEVMLARSTLLETEKNLILSEHTALRLQMNPHFLFNALNAIKGYYLGDKVEEANEYVSQLSMLLRQVLESSSTLITLEKELETVELYINLLNMRYEESFTWTIDQGGLQAGSLQVPPLILQPFVENAIIHGLVPRMGPGELKIAIRQQGEMLEVTIEDNGIGRDNSRKNQQFRPASKGLNISYERLEALNSYFGIDGFAIRISDADPENHQYPGTKVVVEIPQVKEKHENGYH